MAQSHRPRFRQRSPETQEYGTLVDYPLGLSEDAKTKSCEAMNQCLADTMMLRDMYKKHHWQVAGPTFRELHKLFDDHYAQQVEIVDEIAERIQIFGGVAIGTPHDVAEMTTIPRPPKGREAPPVQISRLLEAHETILKFARKAAKEASDYGDEGTNDLFVSDIIRPNEMQVWFLAEHLVPTALVDVGADRSQSQAGAPPPSGPHSPKNP